MNEDKPFTIRNYPSSERYDPAKFLNFVVDCYDVINSPFLNSLKKLPIASYYSVDNGYNDIDRISYQEYNSPYYSFLIMFYNDLTSEIVPEGTILNMFSLQDLDKLYQNLSIGNI